jgi:hypothetical protein
VDKNKKLSEIKIFGGFFSCGSGNPKEGVVLFVSEMILAGIDCGKKITNVNNVNKVRTLEKPTLRSGGLLVEVAGGGLHRNHGL